MALQPASPPPIRNPAGATSAPPWSPMAQSGYGDPTFYHQFFDDFDNQLGVAGLYVTTSSGTGTVAHAAGDGGLALFTTGAVAGNFEQIQLPAASFQLPTTGNAPPGTSTSVKKLVYFIRLQAADVTLSGIIVGLTATGTTPFAAGVNNVTDGLFFYKAAGALNNLQLINVASNAGSPTGTGFTNTFNIPTSAYALANNVNIDLGYFIDRSQNLYMYVGSQLFGYMPQSGFGAVNTAGVSPLPVTGPAMANYNFSAQGATAQSPIMFTQTNLNLTIAVTNGVTAVAKTLTADFHGAQKER